MRRLARRGQMLGRCLAGQVPEVAVEMGLVVIALVQSSIEQRQGRIEEQVADGLLKADTAAEFHWAQALLSLEAPFQLAATQSQSLSQGIDGGSLGVPVEPGHCCRHQGIGAGSFKPPQEEVLQELATSRKVGGGRYLLLQVPSRATPKSFHGHSLVQALCSRRVDEIPEAAGPETDGDESQSG